jgi:hypothetical protein
LLNRTNFDASSISYCRIHPGIGIARLGNSPDDFFIGPEVPDYVQQPKDGLFKDKEGRVKRQAVRFRIYAYDANNKVIKEITSDDGSITWQVHLANRKSLANKFMGFFSPPSSEKRNPDIVGGERERNLVIDPGEVHINGINQNGNNFKFNKGKFFGVEVPLGELRTDEKGRLLVLGGFGRSDCRDSDRARYPLKNFANNNGWFDDISDGPVTASVTLDDGNALSVNDNAWVIVAPPKFAPYHYPLVTLYDTMKQVALAENWLAKPKEVSFMKDIFPILYRVAQYKWLNNHARAGHGKNRGGDFLKDIKILSDNKSQQGAIKRKDIFSRIRNPNLIEPDNPDEEELAKNQAIGFFMPPMAGDGGDPISKDYRTWMKLHVFQYENLERWSQGDFISDWNENVPDGAFEEKRLEELPIEEQPYAIERAGLELSIGAPLYPGIEVTHYFYKKDFYSGKAFRINPDLKPGNVTEQMAIPWQSDFYACADHWWPTARPDNVISEVSSITEDAPREPWSRGLSEGSDMVDKWDKLGFIKPLEINKVTYFVEKERNL